MAFWADDYPRDLRGYDRLRAVYRAIRVQEDSFRTQAKGSQAASAGSSEQPAMVVSGSVSAPSE